MRHSQLPLVLALGAVLALTAACGDDDASVPAADTSGDAGTDRDVATGDAGDDDAPDTSTDSADATDADEGPTPDLRPYSGGACPVIGGGPNTINSSGVDREFEVYLPTNIQDAPVVFFWYGAGGSTQTYEWMAPFATAYDVTIVVPRAMPNMLFEWPIISTNQPANELVFFDDMVACLTETLFSDPRRIYTTGFSAGALWSSYLVMQRSHVLAAAAIFSGGTGSLVRAYEAPEVDIPILGMHGGDTDTYAGLVNFKEQMTEFLDGLLSDGHLVIACDHGLGHTIPQGGLDWGIEFLLAHVYGDTSSPWDDTLPPYLPDYCFFWQ